MRWSARRSLAASALVGASRVSVYRPSSGMFLSSCPMAPWSLTLMALGEPTPPAADDIARERERESGGEEERERESGGGGGSRRRGRVCVDCSRRVCLHMRARRQRVSGERVGWQSAGRLTVHPAHCALGRSRARDATPRPPVASYPLYGCPLGPDLSRVSTDSGVVSAAQSTERRPVNFEPSQTTESGRAGGRTKRQAGQKDRKINSR